MIHINTMVNYVIVGVAIILISLAAYLIWMNNHTPSTPITTKTEESVASTDDTSSSGAGKDHEKTPVTEDKNENEETMNLEQFTSCGCPELVTWHPGRVEHKLECEKFWSLNPGRTKNELLKTEGFNKHSGSRK